MNGFAGVDFLGADAAGYDAAGEALLETGVTAYLPTFITSAEDDLVAALRAIPTHARGARASSARISRARSSPRAGSARIRATGRRDPDPALLDRLLEAGPVRLVTLAPELPGALELIDRSCRRAASSVSLGHSDATAAEAHAAFDRGVRTVTHVFNAMRPLDAPRSRASSARPSLRPDVVLQAIVDGVHLDPDVVRLLWIVAAGRLALVTDAIAGAGLGRRRYRLGASRSTSATASPAGATAFSPAAR